jgi:hypothetical protein
MYMPIAIVLHDEGLRIAGGVACTVFVIKRCAAGTRTCAIVIASSSTVTVTKCSIGGRSLSLHERRTTLE